MSSFSLDTPSNHSIRRNWLAGASATLLAASMIAAAPRVQAHGHFFLSVNAGPYPYYAPYPHPYRRVYYAPAPVYYYPEPVYYEQGYYEPARFRYAHAYSYAHVHRVHSTASAASTSTSATGQVVAKTAPPQLPVYQQPPMPGPGYVWTPGYWDYADGYYWVPGTWVMPPYADAMWTPGYWAWDNDAYVFYPGYWGLSVGYYGGIAYGFGYPGFGYDGGYWSLGVFHYNGAYNNFGNVRVVNAYNRSFSGSLAATIRGVVASRVSFNGPHGATARPTARELAAANGQRGAPLRAQIRQQVLARNTESLRAAVNHGAPPIAATAQAGRFDRVTPAIGANRVAMANGASPTGRGRTDGLAASAGDNRSFAKDRERSAGWHSAESPVFRHGNTSFARQGMYGDGRFQGPARGPMMYPEGPRGYPGGHFADPHQQGQRPQAMSMDRRNHHG
ncbi:MAG TPA: YXWGXW repeat-containing protein [Xanthomonadaceae bacterium]|jgi:hypothetical protein